MTNEDDGSSNGRDGAIGVPSLSEPEPKNSIPSKPATEADLAQIKTEIKKEMSGFERATLRWTRASFIVVFATGLFIGLQWYEMRAGGEDTHTLAEAAKKQAEKSETISDSIGKAVVALDTSNQQAKQALDKTIEANRKALAATLAQSKKALEASINAAQSEQRAYVTIGKPDGTVADIIWPKEETGNAGLMVYFQNNGRLPAKFNWGSDSSYVAIVPYDPKAKWEGWTGGTYDIQAFRPFQPMTRMKSKDRKNIQWSGTVDIAGGGSYQGVLWEMPKERMTQLLNLDRMVMANGKFEYCDGFGNRVCKKFFLSYAKEPYNKFLLVMEGECSDWEMQVVHPLPEYEYLPVCEVTRPELRLLTPSLPKPE